MKHISLILGIFLLSANLSYAEIYVCKKANGTTEYTSTQQAGCEAIKETKVSGYSPMSSGSSSYSYEQETQPANNNNNRRNEAERRLREAEKALEEGRNTRLGNEKNYVKYQERVKGLEEAVEKARIEYERTR
ncbi:MAG: DUF4124 domain-containing protein [Neisseriaceae bacterium]|nr:DUF4124 domain-containing protein [Neisseriaceae bacterium]